MLLMGSGTTAIAYKKLNRRYIGFEVSKEYCDIAKQRLAKESTLFNVQSFVQGYIFSNCPYCKYVQS